MLARLAIATVLIAAVASPDARADVDYLRDVKPILAARCYVCHGALRQQAGLRLDTAASILKGSEGGEVVVPGNTADSLLVEAIRGEAGFRMPPEDEGEPLSAEQIALIEAWINQGAAVPANEQPQRNPQGHWAFSPPKRPPLPAVKNAAWVRNPIDAFIARQHERRGLVPRPPASRATLLRRAYIDLIGLPPTRAELRAFLADTSSDAYEEAVDRLLASPRYGERWGRHWMDIWRYSDWYGRRANNELRNSRRHIWRWRDWIVESLNEDKGYDRMILEMFAGDEIAPADTDVLRATGYLGRNYYVFNRNVWLQDTVEYTGMAMLGLTLKCCRCHDHKFDPIAQEEYYALRAFFEPHSIRTERLPGSIERIKAYSEAKNVTVLKEGLDRTFDAEPEAPTYVLERGDEMRPRKDQPIAPAVPAILGGPDVEIAPVPLPMAAFYPDMRPAIKEEILGEARDLVTKARSAVESAAPDSSPLARAALASAQANLAALEARFAADREKYARNGDSRLAGVLAVLAARAQRTAALADAEHALLSAERQVAQAQAAHKPGDADSQKTLDQASAALAEAKKKREAAKQDASETTDQYTPIGEVYPRSSTGRRLALARWIVSPNNPLAARVCVNHIWLRHMGSALVPTVYNFGLSGKPPTHPELLDWLAVELVESGWSTKALHRLIVTSSTYRMASNPEGVDDPNLAIDRQNVYLWRMNPRRMEAEVVRDSMLHLAGVLDTTMFGPDLDPVEAESLSRRSLYFRHTPDEKPLLLELFDAANPTECFRREVSIVPQQALALVNGGLSRARSAGIARHIEKALESEGGDVDAPAFVTAAFQHVLGREPRKEEHQVCVRFFEGGSGITGDAARESFATVTQAKDIRFTGGAKPAAVLPERARENLIHVLLNYNEFVTVR